MVDRNPLLIRSEVGVPMTESELPVVLLDTQLPDFLQELLDPHCSTVPWTTLEVNNGGELSTVTGIYTYAHPRLDGQLLDRLPELRVISNFGVGVDHIDVAAARKRNVPVGNTPGAVDGATADLTLALLLAAARNVVSGDEFARSAKFTRYDPSDLLGLEVHGSVLGIVGLGRIGRQVARRARAFDMRVLYHNRRRDPTSEQELGVEYRVLDALLAESHFVSLNVPLTTETRNLVGERELRLMRRDAVLVNAARGGVVDHTALLRALSEGWIAAAAIDVTEPEPLPRDHPLLALGNLVITPHLGSATRRTRLRMGKMATANLVAGLSGEPLPHAVI